MPSHTQDGRNWYSISESAAAAGVSRRTIYNWLKIGKLGPDDVRRTVGGCIRINEAALALRRMSVVVTRSDEPTLQ